MLLKGVIYGFIVVLFNYFLLIKYISISFFNAGNRKPGTAYARGYFLKYMVLGALIVLFLKYRLGSIPGLFIGITMGNIAAIASGRLICPAFRKQ
jgi:hypothetical protein